MQSSSGFSACEAVGEVGRLVGREQPPHSKLAHHKQRVFPYGLVAPTLTFQPL